MPQDKAEKPKQQAQRSGQSVFLTVAIDQVERGAAAARQAEKHRSDIGKLNHASENYRPENMKVKTMNTNQKLAILLALFALALTALAQSPTVKNSLTVEEQQQWANLLAAEKQRADTLTQSTNDLLNTQPGPDSIAVHARYQSAWLALRLVRTEAREWLGKLQAAHECKECLVSADGKKLEPVKKDRGK